MREEELAHELGRLTGSIRGAADYVDRIEKTRRLREKASSPAEHIAFALVSAALHQTLKAIPQRQLPRVFRHLLETDALAEARLLVLREEDPAVRLWMLERLIEAGHRSRDRREAERLKSRYGGLCPRSPSEPAVPPHRDTFEAWLERTADHPERRSWKQSFPLLLAAERPARFRARLRGEDLRLERHLVGQRHEAIVEALSGKDRLKFADILVTSGRALPAELLRALEGGPKAALAFHAAQGGEALATFEERLSTMSPADQAGALRRFLLAGGDGSRLGLADLPANLAEVWVEQILRTRGRRDLQRLFTQLLVICAGKPERHALHRDALLATVNREPRPASARAWLEERRERSSYRKAMAGDSPQGVEALLDVRDPIAMTDIFFRDLAPVASAKVRRAGFAAVLRRLGGTTPGAVVHAACGWAERGYLRGSEAKALRLTVLFVEALVYGMKKAEVEYQEQAKAWSATSPKVSYALLAHLPEPKANELRLSLAYERGLHRRFSSAARALGKTHLADAMARIRGGDHEGAAKALFADARRTMSGRDAVWWVLAALVCVIEAPSAVMAALPAELTAPSELPRALLERWRYEAGALEVEPCHELITRLFDGEAPEREAAFWELVNRPPMTDLDLDARGALPQIEGTVLHAVRNGGSLAPATQRRDLEHASTSAELGALVRAPALGGQSPAFCAVLADALLGQNVPDEVLVEALELPGLPAASCVDLLLARGVSTPALRKAVRRCSLDALAGRQAKLFEHIERTADDRLRDVLAERSPFLLLRAEARHPRSYEEREVMRAQVEKCAEFLREYEAHDAQVRALGTISTRLEWTARAREGFRRLYEDEPETVKSLRRALHRMLTHPKDSGLVAKENTPFLALGRERDPYRVVIDFISDERLAIIRVGSVNKHDLYESWLRRRVVTRLRAEPREEVDLADLLFG